jgi:hypothetical protein
MLAGRGAARPVSRCAGHAACVGRCAAFGRHRAAAIRAGQLLCATSLLQKNQHKRENKNQTHSNSTFNEAQLFL